MAVRLGDVFLEAVMKSQPVKQEMDRLEKRTRGWSGRMKGLIATGLKAGIAAGAAALGAGLVGLRQGLTRATDAAETFSLVANSLGPAAEGFNQQIQEIAKNTRRSRFELMEGSSTIIAMSRNMGMGREEAADYSATWAQIAVDLGSFFNVATPDVFRDIAAAQGGSSEVMNKYGVDVRETTLKAMALNKGLIEQGEVLDRLTRAHLIQEAVLTQASDAMGDAERTARSASNAWRGIQAVVTDTVTGMGAVVLPIWERVLNFVADKVTEIGPRVVENFENMVRGVLQRLGNLEAGTVRRMGRIAGFLTAFATQIASWGANLVTTLASGMLSAIGAVVQALMTIGQIIASWLAPGSPPKLLPDLDKWGRETANEWLKGWQQADFGLLREVGSTVRSLLGGGALTAGLAGRVTGTQEAVAEAIRQFRETGNVGAQAFERIKRAAGEAGEEIVGLVRRQFELAAASERVRQIQSALSDIEERRQKIRERAELRGIEEQLAAGGMSAAERQDLLLRAQEIQLRQQLRGAQEQEAAAQSELDIFRERLGLQQEQLSMSQQLANAIGSAASAAGELGEKLKGALSDLPSIPEALGLGAEGGAPPSLTEMGLLPDFEQEFADIKALWDQEFLPGFEEGQVQFAQVGERISEALDPIRKKFEDITKAVQDFIDTVQTEGLAVAVGGIFQDVIDQINAALGGEDKQIDLGDVTGWIRSFFIKARELIFGDEDTTGLIPWIRGILDSRFGGEDGEFTIGDITAFISRVLVTLGGWLFGDEQAGITGLGPWLAGKLDELFGGEDGNFTLGDVTAFISRVLVTLGSWVFGDDDTTGLIPWIENQLDTRFGGADGNFDIHDITAFIGRVAVKVRELVFGDEDTTGLIPWIENQLDTRFGGEDGNFDIYDVAAWIGRVVANAREVVFGDDDTTGLIPWIEAELDRRFGGEDGNFDIADIQAFVGRVLVNAREVVFGDEDTTGLIPWIREQLNTRFGGEDGVFTIGDITAAISNVLVALGKWLFGSEGEEITGLGPWLADRLDSLFGGEDGNFTIEDITAAITNVLVTLGKWLFGSEEDEITGLGPWLADRLDSLFGGTDGNFTVDDITAAINNVIVTLGKWLFGSEEDEITGLGPWLADQLDKRFGGIDRNFTLEDITATIANIRVSIGEFLFGSEGVAGPTGGMVTGRSEGLIPLIHRKLKEQLEGLEVEGEASRLDIVTIAVGTLLIAIGDLAFSDAGPSEGQGIGEWLQGRIEKAFSDRGITIRFPSITLAGIAEAGAEAGADAVSLSTQIENRIAAAIDNIDGERLGAGLFNLIKAAFGAVVGLTAFIGSFIGGALREAFGIGAKDGAKKFEETTTNTVLEALKAVAGEIATGFIGEFRTQVLDPLVKSIVDFFTPGGGAGGGGGGAGGPSEEVKQGVLTMLRNAIPTPDLPGWPDWRGVGESIVDGILGYFTSEEAQEKADQQSEGFLGRVMSAFDRFRGSPMPMFKPVGADIVSGVVEGAEGEDASLRNLVESIVGAVFDALDFSKLSQGIQQRAKPVIDAWTNLKDQVAEAEEEGQTFLEFWAEELFPSLEDVEDFISRDLLRTFQRFTRDGVERLAEEVRRLADAFRISLQSGLQQARSQLSSFVGLFQNWIDDFANFASAWANSIYQILLPALEDLRAEIEIDIRRIERLLELIAMLSAATGGGGGGGGGGGQSFVAAGASTASTTSNTYHVTQIFHVNDELDIELVARRVARVFQELSR